MSKELADLIVIGLFLMFCLSIASLLLYYGSKSRVRPALSLEWDAVKKLREDLSSAPMWVTTTVTTVPKEEIRRQVIRKPKMGHRTIRLRPRF